MRALPCLALLVFSPAFAQAPPPPAPGGQQPSVTVPERPPDVAPGPGKAEAAPKPGSKPEEPKRPDVRTVAGKIGSVAWNEQRFTLEAADGPLAVQIDRNTLVFLESRLGTVRDLQPGLPVRAGLAGARNLATWVEVRQRGVAPTPEQAGAAPMPGTAAGAGGSGGGNGSRGGKGEPPTPSPIPPPSAPAPGTPPGPGPVPGGTGTGR